MHLDLFGHFAQGQRAHRGDPVPEEAFLLFHDFGRGFEDGLLPLVERADQPVGLAQLLVEPAVRGLVAGTGLQFEEIVAIDDQPREAGFVEPDVPAIGAGRDQHVGDDRGLRGAAIGKTRLGIVAAQFGQHVGEILVVDLAHAFEPGDFARSDQIEIVDQPGHAGIVAVRFLGLQRQAFAQRSRADPGGIERLDRGQRLLDRHERGAELIGDDQQVGGQIARFVEFAGDAQRDQGFPRIARHRADLVGKMFRQRWSGGRTVFQIGQFRAARATDIAAAPVAHVARSGLGVDRMVRNIQRIVAAHVGGAVMFLRFGARIAGGLAAYFAHFQQGVGFERIGDESLDFEIGQRQQLDRLLQLRRHHQRLGLPQIETRGQRHGSAPGGFGHHRVKLSPR